MKNKDELLIKVNELIEKCVVSNDRKDDYFRHFLDNKGNAYYVLPSEEVLFNEIVREILQSSFISTKTNEENISRRIDNLIREHKVCKTKVEKEELEDMENIYKNATEITERVFGPIHGLCVKSNSPVSIGKFTFYDTAKHKSNLEDYLKGLGFHDEVIQRKICEMRKHATLVSMSIKAYSIPSPTNEKINEAGYSMNCTIDIFERLQSVFRWLLSFCIGEGDVGVTHDIGIIDFKRRFDSDIFFVSECQNPQIRGYHSGQDLFASHKISIEELQSGAEKLSIDLDALFALCSDTNVANEKSMNLIGNRLKAALLFYGRAYYSFPRPISLLESVTSMEAIVGENEGKLALRFREYLTFLLGEGDSDKRKKLKLSAKKIYSLRSAISHGSDFDVDIGKSKESLLFARDLILKFVTDAQLKELKNVGDLNAYIKKLRDTN